MSDEVDDFLAHFGVKGMKWGKVKDDEPAFDEASTAASYKAVPKPKLTIKQQSKNRAESEAKSKAKLGPSSDLDDSKKEGFHLTGKQVAIGAVGAAAVGLIIYGAYKHQGKIALPTEPLPLVPGSKISVNQFQAAMFGAKDRSWGTTYVQPSSFLQQEFTIPKGHEFHRISRSVEESFSSSTYATSSIADFHRYVVGYRGEIDIGQPLQHISFSAKADIKVPSLARRLEIFKVAVSDHYGINATEGETLSDYNKLSGGSWTGPLAESFFDGMKKAGYNAFIDDMDAGVIGESPLVLIGKQLFTDKVSSEITDSVIKLAENSLTEINNRK